MLPYVDGTSFTVRSYHEPLKWMVRIDDPHVHLSRCLLSLSIFYYTVVYLPGLKTQVSDALSSCGSPAVENVKVEDYIPHFGSVTLSVTRHQAKKVINRFNYICHEDKGKHEPSA